MCSCYLKLDSEAYTVLFLQLLGYFYESYLPLLIPALSPLFLKNKRNLARGVFAFWTAGSYPQRSIIHAEVLFLHSYGG